MVRQGSKPLCFVDKIRVILETLLDTPIFVRREGVAKKKMAKRTGLSVPTVRKYLKMIEGK